MTQSPSSSESRRCRGCSCILSKYNSDDVCSPCRVREITEMYQHPGSIRTAEDLEREGFSAYARSLGLDTRGALERAVDNRILPVKMSPNIPKLVRLIDELAAASHSEVARELEVSRFTVASWRRRLGLSEATDAPADPPAKRHHPKSARVAAPFTHSKRHARWLKNWRQS